MLVGSFHQSHVLRVESALFVHDYPSIIYHKKEVGAGEVLGCL